MAERSNRGATKLASVEYPVSAHMHLTGCHCGDIVDLLWIFAFLVMPFLLSALFVSFVAEDVSC